MSKTGVIVEGGGMRGIYGCGVLDSFIHNGIEFDYNIGVSAGAANVASFAAKQEMRNYRFYTQYAFDERYMSVKNFLKTGSFFGMDFIYDELTNRIDPVDYDTMLDPSHEIVVVATDAQSVTPKYFYSKDMVDRKNDIFKASCAVPAMCRPIEINGRKYFDGGVTDPVPVKKAQADGCDKLVVILTRKHGYVKSKENAKKVYSELLKEYPQVSHALDVRHIAYNNTMKYLYKLEEEGKALLFCPKDTMGVNIITRNRESLDALYRMGRDEAESRLEEVENYLAD